MEITIKLKDKVYKRNIPTRWEEVTFRQFLLLEDCGEDFIKLFSMFTGVDEDTIRKATIAKLDSIIEMLGFLRTKMPANIPKTILGYSVPKDLGFETIGQFSDLNNDLKESKELTNRQRLERYTLYCAMYACKEKYGEYDWKKAEEMKDEFLEAPAVEVLAIGNFTLLKLIALRSNTKSSYRKRHIRKKRLKLAFLAWQMHLGFLVRSCISKLKPNTERTSF
jgi:hypothetical protein